MKLLDYLKNPYQPYKLEINDLKRMIKESKHNERSLEHFSSLLSRSTVY